MITNKIADYREIEYNERGFGDCYMFRACSSLSLLPDISKWNTNNVNNMSGMFYGCLNSIIPKIKLII